MSGIPVRWVPSARDVSPKIALIADSRPHLQIISTGESKSGSRNLFFEIIQRGSGFLWAVEYRKSRRRVKRNDASSANESKAFIISHNVV